MSYDNIPSELRALPNWVCYRLETREGDVKLTKVPYRPSGAKAKANNPSTWSSFDDCQCALADETFDGIGFEFAPPFVGVDLDKCLNRVTGDVDGWAHAIIARLSSYTEVSPSGTGVHILMKGALPAGRRRRDRIEMYDSGRFFTMSGEHIEGTPFTVEERSVELAELHAELFPPEPATLARTPAAPSAVTMSNHELIEKASSAANGAQFAALWRGDWTEAYPSQSEADAALCSMLAFWCRNDEGRIDSLFRQSGLMRDKWNREDYRARTLSRAHSKQIYDPQRHRQPVDLAVQFTSTPDIIPPGQRHNRLRGTAISMNKHGYDHGRIVAELMHLNRRIASPPLASEEIERIAEWAKRSAFTDLGNAQFMAAMFGGLMYWVAKEKQWVTFDGQQWIDGGSGGAGLRAHDAILELHREADRLPADRREAARDWARKSESAGHMEAMVKLAKPLCPAEPDAFDADPWVMHVANGVIDLRNGRLRKAEARDLLRLKSRVRFDSEAMCPRWEQFLAEVFEPHPELIPFIRRAVGYSLTGEAREHCAFFLYGGGANGKSTFLAVVADLLGDYAGTMAHSSLMAKDASAMTNDWASLRGKRFAVAQETREGAALDEAVVKSMTSGDRVLVRALYKDFFQMDPRFKIFLSSNNLPKISGPDNGIWRRIRVVPFDVSFLGKEDRGLQPVLMTEASGILNWAIAGCLEWQRDGLGTAQAVEIAAQQYRDESDEVRLYVSEQCTLEGNFTTRASVLYMDYKAWSAARGEKPMTNAMFGRRMAAMPGVTKRHASSGAVYGGINIKAGDRQERDPV